MLEFSKLSSKPCSTSKLVSRGMDTSPFCAMPHKPVVLTGESSSCLYISYKLSLPKAFLLFLPSPMVRRTVRLPDPSFSVFGGTSGCLRSYDDLYRSCMPSSSEDCAAR